MGFLEDLTSSVGEIFSAKEEVTNQVEEVRQNLQDLNPLDALNSEGGEEGKQE